MTEKKLVWQSAISEITKQDFSHPGLRTVRFIFCDDQPNENHQGILYADFDEVKESAIGTPIKMKFLGASVSGHHGSIPVGHIKGMSEREVAGGVHQLIADGVLYADEYPDEIAYLETAFADGTSPGLSWELSYSSEKSLIENGIEWLKGILTRAATFVREPAYGNRTAILALASMQDISEGQAEVNLNLARTELSEAIKLHQAHMNGTEPTSVSSQQRLMTLIEDAYAAIGSKDEIQTMKEMSELRIVNEGGNNSMDEKELEKLKADFASAQAALTAKEVELAAKVEENSVIVAENTALKASVQEKEQAIAEYTKKELLGARLATITEAGIPLETDPEKLLKKKEFYIGLSDEAFAEYVADLQNVVASVSKPDFIAVASRRAASFPRFDANADSTILLTDLSSRLKGLTRTPVTNE